MTFSIVSPIVKLGNGNLLDQWRSRSERDKICTPKAAAINMCVWDRALHWVLIPIPMPMLMPMGVGGHGWAHVMLWVSMDR